MPLVISQLIYYYVRFGMILYNIQNRLLSLFNIRAISTDIDVTSFPFSAINDVISGVIRVSAMLISIGRKQTFET